MKKMIAVGMFLCAAVTAAVAYPPPAYWCHRECMGQGPVTSPEYKECFDQCMALAGEE